jgi:hypothetical protein
MVIMTDARGSRGSRRDFNIRSLLPPTDDIPWESPRGPEEHKEMARQLGIPFQSANQLLVLAPDNDPYYKGLPAHVRDAEWFAALLDQFGYSAGFHTRRVHYRLVSAKLVIFPVLIFLPLFFEVSPVDSAQCFVKSSVDPR